MPHTGQTHELYTNCEFAKFCVLTQNRICNQKISRVFFYCFHFINNVDANVMQNALQLESNVNDELDNLNIEIQKLMQNTLPLFADILCKEHLDYETKEDSLLKSGDLLLENLLDIANIFEHMHGRIRHKYNHISFSDGGSGVGCYYETSRLLIILFCLATGIQVFDRTHNAGI